jgi:hypothetical protein
MTTVARSYQPAGTRHNIDVRCSAQLPRIAAEAGRCQLFAGHDGPHAVMFAQHGRRTVRLWSGCNPATTMDACPETLQRPWMFGYPVPAWFETD